MLQKIFARKKEPTKPSNDCVISFKLGSLNLASQRQQANPNSDQHSPRSGDEATQCTLKLDLVPDLGLTCKVI